MPTSTSDVQTARWTCSSRRLQACRTCAEPMRNSMAASLLATDCRCIATDHVGRLRTMDIRTAREQARRAALAAEYARVDAAIAAIRLRLWESREQAHRATPPTGARSAGALRPS